MPTEATKSGPIAPIKVQEIVYSTNNAEADYALKVKEMDLQSGMLGKFFGSEKNAPVNIAGVTCVLLVVTGIAVIFFKTSADATDLWKFIAPLISGIIGYLFGSRRLR